MGISWVFFLLENNVLFQVLWNGVDELLFGKPFSRKESIRIYDLSVYV
jgi:hypothetical protein